MKSTVISLTLTVPLLLVITAAENHQHRRHRAANAGHQNHETNNGRLNNDDNLTLYAVEYEDPSYNFAYAVRDDYANNFQEAEESRQGKSTRGSYRVLQPDGVTRTVVYRVNGDDGGFDADVSYLPRGAAQGVPDGPNSRSKRARSEVPEENSDSKDSYAVSPGTPEHPVDFFPAFVPASEVNIQYFTVNDALPSKFTLDDVIQPEWRKHEAGEVIPLSEDTDEATEDFIDPPADPVEDPFAGKLVKLDEVQKEHKAAEAEYDESNGTKPRAPLIMKSILPLTGSSLHKYKQKLPVVDFSHLSFVPAVTGPLIAAHVHQSRQEYLRKLREEEMKRLQAVNPELQVHATKPEADGRKQKHKRQSNQRNFISNSLPGLPTQPQFQQPQFGFSPLRKSFEQPQLQGFPFGQFPGFNPAAFGQNQFPGFIAKAAPKLKAVQRVTDDKEKDSERQNALGDLSDLLNGSEDQYEIQAVSSVDEALKVLKESGSDGAIFEVPAVSNQSDPKELLEMVKVQLKKETTPQNVQKQAPNPMAAVHAFSALAQQSFPVQLFNQQIPGQAQQATLPQRLPVEGGVGLPGLPNRPRQFSPQNNLRIQAARQPPVVATNVVASPIPLAGIPQPILVTPGLPPRSVPTQNGPNRNRRPGRSLPRGARRPQDFGPNGPVEPAELLEERPRPVRDAFNNVRGRGFLARFRNRGQLQKRIVSADETSRGVFVEEP